jgi:hypothetical protein
MDGMPFIPFFAAVKLITHRLLPLDLTGISGFEYKLYRRCSIETTVKGS